MLREAAPWHWIMASAVAALAVATAVLRRRDQAGIAFCLCTISMGLLILSFAAELLAVYWTAMGTGIFVWQVAVAARTPSTRKLGVQQKLGGRVRALVVIIPVWLGLLALLLVRYLPGETYLIASEVLSASDLSRQVALLTHGEYAPALLGVALTLLAAVVGGHLHRGEA